MENFSFSWVCICAHVRISHVWTGEKKTQKQTQGKKKQVRSFPFYLRSVQLTVSFSSSILERRLILRLRVLLPLRLHWSCELCSLLHLRRTCEPGINVERNIVENTKTRKQVVSWDHRRQILNTAHAHFNVLNIGSIPFSGKSQGIAMAD